MAQWAKVGNRALHKLAIHLLYLALGFQSEKQEVGGPVEEG